MQRASIIVNPVARNAPPRERLIASAAAMKDYGWEIDIHETEAAGHGLVLTQEAVSAGASVVFACGGDGTLNEVVNGLVGSETAVGVLRAGMGNVFAKEIGVPRRMQDALELLMTGETHRFDLGVAGERYFLVMCGIGPDAEVVRAVPSQQKRWLGSTSYVLWAVPKLLGHRSRPVQLIVDGRTMETNLYWLLAGNTRSYGGAIDITHEAFADDGLLDTYIFTGGGLRWLLATMARLAVRRQEGAHGVIFQRVGEMEITTPGLPVQVDGEYLGDTPMRFSVMPRALSVLMPAGRGLRLLGAAAAGQ